MTRIDARYGAVLAKKSTALALIFLATVDFAQVTSLEPCMLMYSRARSPNKEVLGVEGGGEGGLGDGAKPGAGGEGAIGTDTTVEPGAGAESALGDDTNEVPGAKGASEGGLGAGAEHGAGGSGEGELGGVFGQGGDRFTFDDLETDIDLDEELEIDPDLQDWIHGGSGRGGGDRGGRGSGPKGGRSGAKGGRGRNRAGAPLAPPRNEPSRASGRRQPGQGRLGGGYQVS